MPPAGSPAEQALGGVDLALGTNQFSFSSQAANTPLTWPWLQHEPAEVAACGKHTEHAEPRGVGFREAICHGVVLRRQVRGNLRQRRRRRQGRARQDQLVVPAYTRNYLRALR